MPTIAVEITATGGEQWNRGRRYTFVNVQSAGALGTIQIEPTIAGLEELQDRLAQNRFVIGAHDGHLSEELVGELREVARLPLHGVAVRSRIPQLDAVDVAAE